MLGLHFKKKIFIAYIHKKIIKAVLHNRVLLFRFKMPKKKRGLSLGRNSVEAKRLKARRQTDEVRAEHAASELAAYHARSQSEEHSDQQRPSTSRGSQSRRTQEKD
jgi:hypothetical protein